MKRAIIFLLLTVTLLGCGGAAPQTATGADGSVSSQAKSNADISDGDFGVKTGDAKSAGGVNGSSLHSTATEAVLKLIVQNDKNVPLPKVVVKIESSDGFKVYTTETDAKGYNETLIPIGKKYKLTYLSLFDDPVEKSVTIPSEPNVTMKLTLTYTVPTPPPVDTPDEGILIPQPKTIHPSLILKGVVFDTAKATLKSESFSHLEKVVEFMTYKPSAMIEVSGHTDNRGKPKKNLKLSEKRALAVRDYLISKGIEGDRIIAVGYGQEKPIATNDTEEGRALNRRTEAKELGE